MLKWCCEYEGLEAHDLRDVPLPILQRWAAICESGRLIDRLSDAEYGGMLDRDKVKSLKMDVMKAAGFITTMSPSFARWYKNFKSKTFYPKETITLRDGTKSTVGESRMRSLRHHVKMAVAELWAKGVTHGRD